uniref:Uncharacterized protein n=1 Tax=Anguilla anguilla TaxID=7936 RepID=A0A0E9TQ72_ANGAN
MSDQWREKGEKDPCSPCTDALERSTGKGTGTDLIAFGEL